MITGPLALIQSLDGGMVVLVLSGLIFVEECGLPLPMAPGDLLLLVAGVAIAAGRVNPLALTLAICFALIAGSMTGREIFAAIGPKSLWAVAGRLGMRPALDRAANRLRRSGWSGVFMARLFPGLRVHTNQVAGVLRIPRRRFIAGVVPSTAVYMTIFIGSGVLFGSAAISAFHAIAGWLILTVLCLGIVGAAAAVLVRRARRGHPAMKPRYAGSI